LEKQRIVSPDDKASVSALIKRQPVKALADNSMPMPAFMKKAAMETTVATRLLPMIN